MKKKFFLPLILAGLVAPQFLFASERVLESSCTKWNLGLVSFWTGSTTMEIIDDITGLPTGQTYEKPCGKTTWIWQ